MCGRFTQERPASELADIFAAEPLADELGARYNVAPTDEAFVIVQRDDRRAVASYRWGLVPHWSTDARSAARMFNARAETITASPAFREAFRRRRCLVPVDSFYEWKRDGSIRQPYRVVRADGAPLALAGLWAGWREADSDVVRRTFTIVTSSPNRTISELHDRMPVVLGPGAWDRWLAPTGAEPTELLAMLEPSDDVELQIYPVNRYVNDVRRDGPDLIEPLAMPATAAGELTLGM
jgi:putative SOS response-associated peptidase YedK